MLPYMDILFWQSIIGNVHKSKKGVSQSELYSQISEKLVY